MPGNSHIRLKTHYFARNDDILKNKSTLRSETVGHGETSQSNIHGAGKRAEIHGLTPCRNRVVRQNRAGKRGTGRCAFTILVGIRI